MPVLVREEQASWKSSLGDFCINVENKQVALSWIYILKDKIQSCLCTDSSRRLQQLSELWWLIGEPGDLWRMEKRLEENLKMKIPILKPSSKSVTLSLRYLIMCCRNKGDNISKASKRKIVVFRHWMNVVYLYPHTSCLSKSQLGNCDQHRRKGKS